MLFDLSIIHIKQKKFTFKGMESRVTMIPASIAEELKMHLQDVKLKRA